MIGTRELCVFSLQDRLYAYGKLVPIEERELADAGRALFNYSQTIVPETPRSRARSKFQRHASQQALDRAGALAQALRPDDIPD